MLGGTQVGYARVTRRWWQQVTGLMRSEGLLDRPLYFVSSNSHSISNLLTVYSIATGRSIPEVEAEYAGKGYGEFKDVLADALVEFLRPLQERHRELLADPGEIARLLRVGAEKARALATVTLAEVYERVGFLSRG